MQERELRNCARCIGCGKLFGEASPLFFWRVTIEDYGLNHKAINRQDGLAKMLGSSALAQVMGQNEEMAVLLSSQTFTLCMDCVNQEQFLLELSQKASDGDVKDKDE